MNTKLSKSIYGNFYSEIDNMGFLVIAKRESSVFAFKCKEHSKINLKMEELIKQLQFDQLS